MQHTSVNQYIHPVERRGGKGIQEERREERGKMKEEEERRYNRGDKKRRKEIQEERK